MATAMLQVDEEALVRAEIDQIKLPKGVKFKRIEQTNEWTGEPALRIYFTISSRIPLTTKRLADLSALDREVFERVNGLHLGKWPFFELIEVA